MSPREREILVAGMAGFGFAYAVVSIIGSLVGAA